VVDSLGDISPMRLLPAVIALASLGCGIVPRLRSNTPPPPAAPPPPSRPVPYPVPESNAFARAVARGTRTRTGEPGANYWQQYARYRINAELVPSSSQLTGRETVWYINHSPDTLPELYLFVDQNLFAPKSPRNTWTPVTGGLELFRVAVGGLALAKGDTGATYWVEGTVMHIGLPRRLLPRDSVELDLSWAFQVPPDGAPREGTTGDVFMVAYWYPRLAVYDDVNGWQIDPYLGTAEFYMGYADYEVNLNVPQGWLVGATGELTNPTEVLSRQTQNRLTEARRGAGVVHVVREQDRGTGATKATNTGFDGVLTWKFRARNVRDFDWGASSKFLWDATTAVVGDRDADGRPDTTTINTFYRPDARRWSWDRSAYYEQSAVEFLSTYLWPYPWPQMTALEGPTACSGMEYPMLTCIGGPRDTLSLFSVQIHETGHMWFPMQVGSDERRFAWQDEGLTRFNQAQGMQWYFKGYNREAASRDAYIAFAKTDGEVPLMRHGDQYPFGTPAYSIATYEKMATNLMSLRALLGDTAFLSIYRTYGQRWQFKHPTQYDFFNTFNSLAGKPLGWFWRTWWYETWTLDQAVASVTPNGQTVMITIEDRGLAPMPVRLAVTRGDKVERIDIPVDVWLKGAKQYTLSLPAIPAVTAVEIDPENVFPDVDRSNNRWVKQ